MLPECLLVTALILVLALYGALLAHEPALRPLATAGGYLTVPLLAAAVLRLALLGLDRPRRTGADPTRWRPRRLALATTVLLEV
jgi:hypothetical protein